jgi:hypothetical protein
VVGPRLGILGPRHLPVGVNVGHPSCNVVIVVIPRGKKRYLNIRASFSAADLPSNRLSPIRPL